MRVARSMSTNTGVAPTYTAALALAANDSGEVATTSPGPSPAANAAACNAAVPLEKATANLKRSKFAREYLGDTFVDHYVASREWEWRQSLDAVTDWELKRYFEII